MGAQHQDGNRVSGLTDFQVEFARLFFSLPASDGFLLAGASGLLAAGLTARPTQDLDFFGAPNGANIRAASEALETAAAERGWRCERVQESDTFVRLRLSGAEELIVDLAIDVPPGRPPAASSPRCSVAPKHGTSPTCSR
jgi:hypothetical protein